MNRKTIQTATGALLVAALLTGCGRSANTSADEQPTASPSPSLPSPSAFPTSTYVPTATAVAPGDPLSNALLSKDEFDKVFHSTFFNPPTFETVGKYAERQRTNGWVASGGTPETCYPAWGLGTTGEEGTGAPDDDQTIATEFASPNSNSNMMVIALARNFKNAVSAADFVKAVKSRTAGCSQFSVQGLTKTFSASDAGDYGVTGIHWSLNNTAKASHSEIFIMSRGNIVIFFSAATVEGAKFPPEDLKSLLSLQQAKLQNAL